jgi:hypothetical protein
MKKILKIFGIIVGVFILLLALTPLFFKGTLEKLVRNSLAKNVNAKVDWSEMDLSLFSSFPDAALTLKDFSVVNNKPFEGDTLASGKLIELNMGITQLFKKSNEPIKVDAIYLDEAFVNIKIDSLGNANYDIAKKSTDETAEEATSEDDGFTFALSKYELNNARINYLDEATQTFLRLTNVNHTGTGDLSAKLSELDTETEGLVSLQIEDIEYLKNNKIALDAVFQLDLENQKYTFLENEAKINELPLTFNGFVKVNENNNELDITFKTPSSDFKNFLAVIPEVYVKEISDVKTTGSFTVDGMLKGIVDDTRIPTMDIKINSSNASFKYPDLPKEVRNITIDAQLKNETGLPKDTYVTIGNLTFKIDDELFSANGSIKNLTENALINLALKGTLNLAKIDQVLPIELDQNLTGIFKADLTTNFDMASIEKEQYQNIKSNGNASLTGFTYNDDAFKNELKIDEATIDFVPGTIKLNSFKAASGQTDIDATGTIQNLIPWILAKEDLKGRFNVKSNTFNVNDFMTSEDENNTSRKNSSENNTASLSESSVKIPDFLDATLDFSANKVIYDNITLTNTKGSVAIQEETAKLSNITSNIFGGNIAFSGNVSTKNEVPRFAMNLDLKKVDIGQSFQQLDLLKYIAPIAKALEGDINTTLALEGELTKDLTPKLSTLAGNVLAQILTAEVNSQNAPLLSKLGEKVSFLNLEKLSLRDLSTALTFNNGNIEVQPFDFEVKGIKIKAQGSHGLDKTINYQLDMDVPAKYLGGEVTKLLSKLDPEEAENTSVKLPIGLNGTITSPTISVDTKAAVTTLTQKLIDKQKEELVDKGTDILQDLINGNNKPKDSTSTNTNTTEQTTTDVVKDVLGGLFGRKKKKQDSTKSGN